VMGWLPLRYVFGSIHAGNGSSSDSPQRLFI
jgi:hypothetical protein